MKKLNLGCGGDYREGWTNQDFVKKIKADVYCDLEKKLPFKSNTFEYVYASHTMEHINNLTPLMKELKRVCKNGAIIEIIVPSALCCKAYQDPTHVRFFTYHTMDYYTEDMFYDLPKFKVLSRRLDFLSRYYPRTNMILSPFNFLINTFPNAYERIFGWIFPCGQITYRLLVIK